jgi:hypothetical protein
MNQSKDCTSLGDPVSDGGENTAASTQASGVIGVKMQARAQTREDQGEARPVYCLTTGVIADYVDNLNVVGLSELPA